MENSCRTKKFNDYFINDLRTNYLYKQNPELGKYYRLVDKFYYSEIQSYIKNYPDMFIINFFKGIYAMHGLSSYPTKYLILAKIYNFDYPQDNASIKGLFKKKSIK